MHRDFKGVMRPGQNKRSRNRNNMNGGAVAAAEAMAGQQPDNRPRPPHRMQTFDSNGPSVKIRGNAYQVFERYIALAREAASSGDRIAAENLYQHAEHYFRVMNANGEGQRQSAAPAADDPGRYRDGPGSRRRSERGARRQQPQAPAEPEQPAELTAAVSADFEACERVDRGLSACSCAPHRRPHILV